MGRWLTVKMVGLALLLSPPVWGVPLINEPIQPIPLTQAELNKQQVALGELLYHDTRLSGDGTLSCASCHPVNAGGMDGLPVSVGIRQQKGGINAPTVLNARYNLAQFWDGRADSLESQALGPVTNPIEMGARWEGVLERLNRDKKMRRRFSELFPHLGITKESISLAIATYERSLTTPNAPFDRYLRGDLKAVEREVVEGYELFKSYGCVACHQGVNVGGNMYQTFGLFGNYFKDRQIPITKSDYGRFNVTAQEEDRFAFKVPSLRNVALTAPYFHDGRVKSLSQAVQLMAHYQLGRQLSAEHIEKIVAFLHSLTGTQPEAP
ncbi:Cytochrome-c peroxidase [Magnetococcus marinus MC-1]|uniref:Cytochrome-c peroxidase n=1 Tax=Magnetococcus marinus (strain ATCC BAA-1437 / JCM 17883 / MC-1) TaxID=156889 RepID=A0L7Q4_MAGMM|nr:cytochrome-c peroxidase [Magnetococcus marinus]ABK43997.1 Cytochrome-c peroxidase [Magnetococcus marinus MC-1]